MPALERRTPSSGHQAWWLRNANLLDERLADLLGHKKKIFEEENGYKTQRMYINVRT
jgi:hypothetical protein